LTFYHIIVIKSIYCEKKRHFIKKLQSVEIAIDILASEPIAAQPVEEGIMKQAKRPISIPGGGLQS
jgi:hypothetical protein